MDRFKRSVLPLLLVLCMLLSGCGSDNAAPDESDSDAGPSVSQSVENQNQQQGDAAPTDSPDVSDTTPEPSASAAIPSDKPASNNTAVPSESPTAAFSMNNIPSFTNQAYIAVNNNEPYFSSSDKARTDAFETYSSLDSLGRCGVAYANICKDIMPTEERGEIGSVKPSGWQTAKYDFVDGKYLYNRCHLIGFQLAGENANNKNLITGTRYLNIEGMLPFENMVDDYVDETGNHVLYRVTPVFTGNNLIADGVLMEGWSVEDGGDGICFCVFAYNNQPGVEIDYATGNNHAAGDDASTPSTSTPATTTPAEKPSSSPSTTPAPAPAPVAPPASNAAEQTYILNTNSKKFHYPSCSSVDSMKEENKQEYTGSRDDLISQGYDPCKRCNP